MKRIEKKYLGKLKIVDTELAITKNLDYKHIIANMVVNNCKVMPDSILRLHGKKTTQ